MTDSSDSGTSKPQEFCNFEELGKKLFKAKRIDVKANNGKDKSNKPANHNDSPP